jgi:glucose-1-phosphatase
VNSLPFFSDILGKNGGWRKLMAEKIKAIIFDMGGVLLRSEDFGPRETLAKEYGLTQQQLEDLVFFSESALIATTGKIDEREHWKRICDSLHVPEEKREDFENRFWQGDELDTSLVDFLRSLRPQYKTALLSNAWSGTRDFLTYKHKIIEVFDISMFSYEVGLAKPDPAIYALILKRIGVKADEAIFVDDNKSNIEAANSLGIHGILFHSSAQTLKEIRELL